MSRTNARARPVVLDIPAGAQSVPCRGPTCGDPLWWVTTTAGRSYPVDVANPDAGDLRAPTDDAPGRGALHFARCPDAEHFRPAGSRV